MIKIQIHSDFFFLLQRDPHFVQNIYEHVINHLTSKLVSHALHVPHSNSARKGLPKVKHANYEKQLDML